MLLHLTIQNFAIVRALEIDWHAGMTTITGETGAGKSIAIDALGLCLGERATTNIVRPNAKKAELAATFDVTKNTFAQNWLRQHDLCQDGLSTHELNHSDDEHIECILRRVVSNEGRSKAYINGIQVPLAQLKELGQMLINIHGQHDHQLIVKSSQQCKLLDEYADHASLLEDVKHYYQQWNKLNKELVTLQLGKEQREAQLQLINYQVTELNDFDLQPGEFITLESDYKRHSNAQDLLDTTLQSLETLSRNENVNILDNLRQCHDNISKLSSVDNRLVDVSNMLCEALIQAEEANSELEQYYQHLELDPQAYALIESRYSTSLQLAKKHQVSPEDLHSLHQELCKQQASFSSNELRIDTVLVELDNCLKQYHQAAYALTESRKLAGKSLSELITRSMQELNMPHGQFSIVVEATQPEQSTTIKLNGLDQIDFMVSINPGQTLEAMNKVASGGELSRISLAMQVILADKVITPTLIFDEVDVGISGPTAAMVGSKLQELAINTQVICVTHLPQVACKGHQQLFVSKLSDSEHTETNVTLLGKESRVNEIARLLAGDKISEHSLANAQELLAG
jgi:DNA repair protein RecN (Recombination protein N)